MPHVVSPAPVFALKRGRRSGDAAARSSALAELITLAFGPQHDPQAEAARVFLGDNEGMHVVWSEADGGWTLAYLPERRRAAADCRAPGPAGNVVALCA